eukprot:scaffold15356_cov80-Skeletonema_marinoi.AAC.3
MWVPEESVYGWEEKGEPFRLDSPLPPGERGDERDVREFACLPSSFSLLPCCPVPGGRVLGRGGLDSKRLNLKM